MNVEARPQEGEAILRFGPCDEGFGYTLAGRPLWTDRPLPSLGPPEARGRLPQAVAPLVPIATSDPDRFEELALGPPILLLLAVRAIWALHASAVFVAGRLFVFLGESGRGKSTLAALAFPGWERVADDLLPFELVRGRLVAHLDYPQLKLDPPRRLREPAPVAALIALAGPGSASEPQLTRLALAETARLLMSQTIAARRYNPELLAAHFETCLSAANAVPAYRLSLPRDLVRLPEAGKCISGLARS
ncbi:MAG TPA: hypothetical protein VGS22_04800 [Thermoanaerobaculia bacterium]|jgi:hypothetical protein|nr:hypothetical protein [Thermoanaerobaculia bacterium]